MWAVSKPSTLIASGDRTSAVPCVEIASIIIIT